MSAGVIKTGNIVLIILLIVVGAGLFGLTSFGDDLEAKLGLPWLFKLRGSAMTPKEIVIVSIDKPTVEVLQLPDDPEKWPRFYYADLIKKLNQYNPAVIAINITFNESRGFESDQNLAEAISQSKNIILSNYLKQNTIESTSPANKIVYEQFINPIYILEKASTGVAPFPLPKTAETIKQFWPYTKTNEGVATFPVAVFQYYLFKQSYVEIVELLMQLNLGVELPDLTGFRQPISTFNAIKTIQKVNNAIITDPQAINRLDQLLKKADFSRKKLNMLQSWLTLLNSSKSLYLNHYGTAGEFATIPLYQVLKNDDFDPAVFKNKVVLVGYSENIEPEKNQGIYTVFSKTYTATTSPIEIAATAIANLIENTRIKPLSSEEQFVLILVWGVLLLGLSQLQSLKQALLIIIVFSLGYISIAMLKFTSDQVWIPFFIPIFVQVPFAIFLSFLCYFMKIIRERKNVQTVFGQFIPGHVVNKISHSNNLDSLNEYGEVMYGVCMSTDAEKYTTLSETIDPKELNILMNSYYGVMFPSVKKSKGIISDVIGDAMLAIWAKPEQQPQIRSDACHAALEIISAIENFNRDQLYPLSTRVGLHYGEIRLGNVGAEGHYEYRAIGDTVNTASRIEPLNKTLGTQILVSSTVIENLSGILTREMGYFILKGKKKPVRLYELIANQDYLHKQILIDTFTQALKLFQCYQWDEALTLWQTLQNQFPNDGPTNFYINYLTQKPSFLPDECHQSEPVIVDIVNVVKAIEKN